MDNNRLISRPGAGATVTSAGQSSRTGPFPGSLTIPEKLRKLLHEAEIQPTEEGRIPWISLPHILYEKSLYLSGLPTKLFFSTDKPSPQEVAKRVEVPLKWPPPGLPNPLKMLKDASDKGNIKLLPRSPDQDIVFRVYSEDGTSVDLGKWKTVAPVTVKQTAPSTSSRTPVTSSTPSRPALIIKDSNTGVSALNANTNMPNKLPSPIATSPTNQRSPRAGLPSSAFVARHAVSPTKPSSPTKGVSLPTNTQPTFHTISASLISKNVNTTSQPTSRPAKAKPTAKMKTTTNVSTRRSLSPESSSSSSEESEDGEPFPGNARVPLLLRELFKEAGVQSVRQGCISWRSIPHVLWKNGLYITGIPSMAILEANNPSAANMASKMSMPFQWKAYHPHTQALVQAAADNGEIKLLKRPEDRNVTFELITSNGPIDLGRWNDMGEKKYENAIQKENKKRVRRRKSPVPDLVEDQFMDTGSGGDDDDSDDDEKSQSSDSKSDSDVPSKLPVTPSTAPFHRTKVVFKDLRYILIEAGVRDRDGLINWPSVPHDIWESGKYISGLRAGFVLGDEDPVSVTHVAWRKSMFFLTPSKEKDALRNDAQAGRVKVHARPPGRNVVFEVINPNGTLTDVGKWQYGPEEPNFMQRTYFPQKANFPSINNEIAMDDHVGQEQEQEPESVNEYTGPSLKWSEEVNAVLDELADMLVQAKVLLPPHPTRPNAHWLFWQSLPKLLHEAKVTLVGWPLRLLPYKRDLDKLNGKWSVKWNRYDLDDVKELLDCDGLSVQKWNPSGREIVVQALDDNKDCHDYSYDDFVTAEYDDPEMVSRDGQLVISPAKRKWSYFFSDEDREDEDRDVKKRRHLHKRVQLLMTEADGSSAAVRSLATSTTTANVDASISTNTNTTASGSLATASLATTSERGSEIPERSRYWEPEHPDLPIPELNAKYARQKEIIRSLIAILLYYDIPCIAPPEEDYAFFLPWRNLPRHLAARNVYISGFPVSCVPWIDRDVVMPESSPAYWGDDQWEALGKALEKNEIDLVKTQRKVIFELVQPDGKKELSVLQFSRPWIKCNFGTEIGQSVSVYADEVLGMDPIVEESEVEDDDSMEIDV